MSLACYGRVAAPSHRVAISVATQSPVMAVQPPIDALHHVSCASFYAFWTLLQQFTTPKFEIVIYS